MKILVINAGSSSLKYQLMDPTSGEVFAKGLCERIYIDGKLTHKVPATGLKVERDIPMPTHSEAIEAVLSILVDPEYGVLKSTDEIDAIGHRVLHGGDKFVESCIIDEAPQPRQPHGHRGLREGHAGQAPGRRVRHCVPYDHAPEGLSLRHSHEVL